jgi:hypothetical protein
MAFTVNGRGGSGETAAAPNVNRDLFGSALGWIDPEAAKQAGFK